jgi:hypothetical protein
VRTSTGLVLLTCLLAAGISKAADERWNTYGNPRYGFSVCYPPSLKPQGEPDDGDGNAFKSADGKLIVRAYANYSIEPEGGPKALEEAFHMSVQAAQKQGYKVSYQMLKPNLFAYSGVADGGTPKGRVIYQKTFERASDKLDVSLEAEYPESLKATADPLVAHMAACLDGGKSPF